MLKKVKNWIHQKSSPQKSQNDLRKEQVLKKQRELKDQHDFAVNQLTELKKFFQHIFGQYNRRTRKKILMEFYNDPKFADKLIADTISFYERQREQVQKANVESGKNIKK